MDLEKYFPNGDRGFVLISTRSPAHKIHGNVGDGFFDLTQLESEAAACLVLRAANEPQPWTSLVAQFASDIARTLGYLPLALIVAGKTILKGLCTLSEYLEFYNAIWKRTRHRSVAGLADDGDPHMSIYGTCEVMHMSLRGSTSQTSCDAVELLKVFSFLQRENISLDLLIRSATSPKVEKQENERQHNIMRSGRTWMGTLAELVSSFLMAIFVERESEVLPKVLQWSEESEEKFDVFRLRRALTELSQRSLIMYNAAKDNYTIHPIVHTWVRERPEMKTVDQAIYCQAAATLLAQSILLPPLAMSERDEDFKRDLLPHIMFMRRCEQDIRQQFLKNQQSRKRLIPALKPAAMGRGRAISSVKYSLIYSQCGLWNEAEELQRAAYEFFQKTLGSSHPHTIHIQVALACINWHLGRGTEAAVLQRQALKSAKSSLGKQDYYKIMDSLGLSQWMSGHIEKSLEFHQTAVEGLRLEVGENHEDTLRAMGSLGHMYEKCFRFEEARHILQKVVDGLKKTLGKSHLDTLVAIEDLAMTNFEIDELQLARQLQEEVVERRVERLGKEHPYSLLAAMNLARIKAAQGDVKEAKDDIVTGLLVAYRTLGADHVGVLYARTYLGETLLKMGNLHEAEEVLNDTLERYKRLWAAKIGVRLEYIKTLYIFADCLGAQARIDEAITACRDAIHLAPELGGQNHLFLQKLQEKQRQLIIERDLSRS